MADRVSPGSPHTCKCLLELSESKKAFTLQNMSTYNLFFTKIIYCVIVPSLLHRAEYDCFQIELSKKYGAAQWREDVKSCLLKDGINHTAIVFLFSDTQVLVLVVCIFWEVVCFFIPRLHLES